MPDLVPNQSVAADNSATSVTTTMQHHLQGRNDPQISVGNVSRHTYSGHQVHHLIRSPTQHYSTHHSQLHASNQHESTGVMDQVLGTK